MRTYRWLTLETLKVFGACPLQRAKFKRRFGKRGAVTEARCIAVAQAFDFVWAGYNLLSSRECGLWEQSLDEARDVRDAAITIARKGLQWWENDSAAQHAAVETARKAYNVERARMFARAYLRDA